MCFIVILTLLYVLAKLLLNVPGSKSRSTLFQSALRECINRVTDIHGNVKDIQDTIKGRLSNA